MASWLDDLTDAAGNVMDIAQDVIETVGKLDPPSTPPISTPTPPTAGPVGSTSMMGGLSQDSLLLVLVVVVLAVVLLR